MREKQRISPHTTLTVDSLFSSISKPLDLMLDNVYMCVSAKKSVVDVLSYKLARHRARVFKLGNLTITVYHDQSVHGQITSTHAVQLSETVASVMPSPVVDQESDQTVLLLAEVAKSSSSAFGLLQVAFGSPSTKTPLPAILSTMTNKPILRVRSLLESAATPSGVGSGTQSRPEMAEIASTVCSLYFIAQTTLLAILSDSIQSTDDGTLVESSEIDGGAHSNQRRAAKSKATDADVLSLYQQARVLLRSNTRFRPLSNANAPKMTWRCWPTGLWFARRPGIGR